MTIRGRWGGVSVEQRRDHSWRRPRGGGPGAFSLRAPTGPTRQRLGPEFPVPRTGDPELLCRVSSWWHVVWLPSPTQTGEPVAPRQFASLSPQVAGCSAAYDDGRGMRLFPGPSVGMSLHKPGAVHADIGQGARDVRGTPQAPQALTESP